MRRKIAFLMAASLLCVSGCSADVDSNTPGETGASVEESERVDESSSLSEGETQEETAEESSSQEETAEESSSEKETQKENSDETETEESEESGDEEAEDIFGLEGARNYDYLLEYISDYTFSADEWLDADGNLSLPFDEDDEVENNDADIRKIRYYIPEEALKAASTSDLLSICTNTMFAETVIAFDSLQYQVQYLASNCNAVDEVFARDDFAETLLEAYKAVDLMKYTGEYSEETNDKACAIITMELFLARDEVFDMMTDEMREETLEAVMEKQAMILGGDYDYSLYDNSCFFAYIAEMVSDYDWLNFEGSKWYDYISENHSEYLEYCVTIH